MGKEQHKKAHHRFITISYRPDCKMVLKNLIKARKGHEQALSDDAQLVSSGLLPGFEALPTVVLVLESARCASRLRTRRRSRCWTSRDGN